ncbi:hypothetical protein [Zobellia galactanivorans]|uniref:Hypothetical membrane protein n=2 Tax=Flavobacteriaceae TaxID=49546 RepID=G0L3Q0_ZOBGA|nr:hypothetical protein [Zobellia galactanivorans]CAZ95390.1 Hypothetical membrane protein [Zobellia galactanivorans]
MAKEKLVMIKEAELTNNCPECFNQDLKVSFYQKHKYGKLFHSITNEVTHEIVCNKCESKIYPVSWTDDIERSFKYYQKMVTPDRNTLKFTPLFWVLILLIVAIVAAGIYFTIQQT